MAALSPSKKSTRAKRCSERIPLTVTCTSPLLGADLLTFEGGNWVISGKISCRLISNEKKSCKEIPAIQSTSSPGLFPQKMGEGKALGTRLPYNGFICQGKNSVTRGMEIKKNLTQTKSPIYYPPPSTPSKVKCPAPYLNPGAHQMMGSCIT